MLLPPLFHARHHHQFFTHPQPLGFSLGRPFSAHGFPLFAWFPSLPPFFLLQNDEPHPFYPNPSPDRDDCPQSDSNGNGNRNASGNQHRPAGRDDGWNDWE